MRVEIYGCYWNGRFRLIHCVLTSRISLFLDILLRHFSQVVVWKCQPVIWCLTMSERKLIFHSLKERAGIAQYQRGNWYFIVSIKSWHHTVTARKLIFHSIGKRAGITHCRRSGQGFNPVVLWRECMIYCSRLPSLYFVHLSFYGILCCGSRLCFSLYVKEST
jgi:hypothetical protein